MRLSTTNYIVIYLDDKTLKAKVMDRISNLFSSKKKSKSGIPEEPPDEKPASYSPPEDEYRQVTLLVIGAGNRGTYMFINT